MTRPEIVHHTSGNRTKSSDFRSVPSSREARDLPKKALESQSLLERLRRSAVSLSVVLVVILTLWGALTYYNERRNSPENLLSDSIERIYTIGYQTRAQNQIDRQKASTRFTMDHMLIEANPFGTNTNSLYIFFVTEQPMSVSYSVSAPETNYPTFSRTVSTTTQRGRTHEFQVIGLIPSTRNVVTFTITDAAGEQTTRTYSYDMGDVLSNEPVQISVSHLAHTGSNVPYTNLGDGLFAVMPRSSGNANFTYLYDSDGVLRGEIPLKNSSATRFIQYKNHLYYAISPTQIVAVDRTGYVDNFINFGDRYSLAGDFTMDSAGNIVAIATDGATYDETHEVGTYVVRISALNGKTRMLVNTSTLLNSYRSATEHLALAADGTSTDSSWNWLGLNSIAMIDDDTVLLSSRETSSLLSIDISTDSPNLTSIIGPAGLWTDPKYSYLLLAKNGDFSDFAGQSSLTISDVSSSGYTLTLLNNNFAYSPSNPSFNWSAAIPQASQRVDPAGTQAHSFVYTLHVDPFARTYSLESSVQTDYSALDGNAQKVENMLVTTDTWDHTWTVYDGTGSELAHYSAQTSSSGTSPLAQLRSVQYLPLNGFYFAGQY
ncbi:aryl-sulfate sulfotransferase [Alloscardovia criceti]|uniref:aryl-sulfate sulfotransferase n=1 Tax=Alloscardovia criceti TaxID=356828 RepID=UPI00037FA390|nr:aryl-sulfate sulfotransferase [Alloscardovia criceti]